jgi:hypothetical protein
VSSASFCFDLRVEITKHMPTKFENIKNNGTISLLKMYVAARNNNEKNKKQNKNKSNYENVIGSCDVSGL